MQMPKVAKIKKSQLTSNIWLGSGQELLSVLGVAMVCQDP